MIIGPTQLHFPVLHLAVIPFGRISLRLVATIASAIPSTIIESLRFFADLGLVEFPQLPISSVRLSAKCSSIQPDAVSPF